MTVAEASQKWKVKKETVIKYIANDFIYDLSIENDQLILPDINKPKIIPKNRKRNVPNIYHWILQACENREYINAKIIGIGYGEFMDRIDQLVTDGFLFQKEDVKAGTNIGYRLTAAGIERLNPKKNTTVNILPINATVKANIGAGNIML